MVDPFVRGKPSENALVRHDPFLESHRQSCARLLPIPESLLVSLNKAGCMPPQTQTSSKVPAQTFRVAALNRSPSPTEISASANNSLTSVKTFCSSCLRSVPGGWFSIDLNQSHSNSPFVNDFERGEYPTQ